MRVKRPLLRLELADGEAHQLVEALRVLEDGARRGHKIDVVGLWHGHDVLGELLEQLERSR